jgi:transcriptional regulator with XRE-family HTH domain
MPKFTPISVHDLGDYLREQRQTAKLSLRQLSEVAGISNPYISQIERGLKKPSAEILQALAKALRISAESLYVRAGILEERTDLGRDGDFDVTDAVLADPKLNDRQRAVLLDVYESFVGEPAANKAPASGASKTATLTQHATPTQSTKPTKPTQSTKPGRAPSPEKSGLHHLTPGQLTAELKKTQQSSNKEKKS